MRKVERTLQWNARGPSHSQTGHLSVFQLQFWRLQGSFQEAMLQSTQEAPQTERSPTTSRNLFKKLQMCDLEEKVHFHEEKKGLLVAGRVLKPEESDSGVQLCCESLTSTSPGSETLSQVLLCFLSMVLTALPVFQNCARRTILREKNQYSIVLFLCHPQTERSRLFIVLHLSL